MPSTNQYPPLKLLLPVENLPSAITNITGGLSSIFDKIYYREYYPEKTKLGDAATYNIILVVYDRLGIEIPGTNGLALVLNQGLEADGINTTEFSVTLEYELEIVKYIYGLTPDKFAADPIAYFNTLIGIGGLSISQITEQVISTLIDDPDPINKFITDFNTKYNPTTLLTLNSGTDPDTFVDLAIQIEENGKDTLSILLEDYIKDIDLTETLNKLKTVFVKWFDNFEFDDILKKLLIPTFKASINDINLALEFPRSILKPVYYNISDPNDVNNNKVIGEEVDWDGTPLANPLSEAELAEIKSRLTFTVGTLNFSSENGFEFENEGSFSFQKSLIGNTGLLLYFDDLKLDFSRTRNISEAIEDGRPDYFVGVYVEEAEIGLPAKWFGDSSSTLKIVGSHLLIGTGGISGKLGLIAVNSSNPITETDALWINLGSQSGFRIGFKSFDIAFQQNSITESNIAGVLELPASYKNADGNQVKIGIDAHIGSDGDFVVTAKETQGIQVLKYSNGGTDYFSLKLTSLSIGEEDGRFFVAISGAMTITAPLIGNTLKGEIDIKKLIIWEDGSFEFSGGGTLQLPKTLSIKVGPAEITITAIHLGSHEQMHGGVMRKYKYFGFDGGVSVNPGGVDAKGDGIKFYFTVDGDTPHFFLRIQSLKVDIIIPGNVSPDKASVLISGYLAMKGADANQGGSSADTGEEYAGGVSIALPKVKISATAGMRFNPKIPNFLVDLDLELPVAIPLGATGLGIYGFRGLIGKKYVTSKTYIGLNPEDSWYEYYKKKYPQDYKEGIWPDKFEPKDGFSVGAGVSLATMSDSGKAFSSKLFLLLSLPEVLLIQGQAQILKERIGLDTTNDPPFSAIIAITNSSVETAFGVNYKLPDSGSAAGKILTIDALLEMGFFFNNAGAWYINLGRDIPESKRIKARILSLFDAYSFLMLSGSGIKAGAGISYYIYKKFGPLSAELSAYLDIFGKINFVPSQLGGYIDLGGSVKLAIWKFGLTVSVEASVAAEVPHPFFVTGTIKACIKVLKKNRCASFSLTWIFDDQLNKDEIELHLAGDGSKAVNNMSGEVFPLFYNESEPDQQSITNDFVIPLDSLLKIDFKKPVSSPGITTILNNIGNSNTVTVPEKKGKLEQVTHTFTVEEVSINYWDGSQWKPYDIYGALTPLVNSGINVQLPASPKIGSWQSDNGDGKNTKLYILGQNPLVWTREGTELPVLENFNMSSQDLYCPDQPADRICMNFNNYKESAIPYDTLLQNKAIYQIKNYVGEVEYVANPFGLNQSLVIQPGSQLEIYFTEEPVADIKLKLGVKTAQGKVSFYSKVRTDTDITGMPVFDYQLVSEKTFSAIATIEYSDVGNPIDKIVIEPIDECPDCNERLCGAYTDGNVVSDLLSALAINNNLLSTVNDGGTGTVHLDASPYNVIYNEFNRLPQYLPNIVAGNLYYWIENNPDSNGLSYFTAHIGSLSESITISLSLDDTQTPFVFSNIKKFTNLRINPQYYNPGNNLNGLIDAVLGDGSTRTMKITSSRYVLTYCKCADLGSKVCEKVVAMINSLTDKKKALQLDYDNNLILANSSDWPQSMYFLYIANRDQIDIKNINIQLENLYIYKNKVCGSPKPIGFPCGLYFFEACWLTISDWNYNQEIPSYLDVLTNTYAMVNAMSVSLQPIWRPDTKYYLKIRTLDKLSLSNSGNTITSYDRPHYYGFKTAGPIGHFHIFEDSPGITYVRPDYNALLQKNNEDQYKLAKLEYYIDFSKSYPNADGRLTNAKPLFYQNPALLLFFSYQEVYTMYNNFDILGNLPAVLCSLDIKVKDPESPDAENLVEPQWMVNENGTQGNDVTLLNNLMQGPNCVQVDNFSTLGINLQYTPTFLKPEKLYTSLFISTFKGVSREVHTYPFRTSKYANASEQINSYIIKDETGEFIRNAFYDIEKELTIEQLENAKSILGGSSLSTHAGGVVIIAPKDPSSKIDSPDPILNSSVSDDLELQYALKFDRLIDGVFQLSALSPAKNTEFNILWNTQGTGSALGILIRNPEPFNDPKIDESLLSQTIAVMTDATSGVQDTNYIIIHSKDLSSVFITKLNDQGYPELTESQINIQFRYLTFNGTSYTVKEPATDETIVTVDIFTSVTKLITSDCGRFNVVSDDVLTAELLSGITEYEFLITKPVSGLNKTYRRENADGLFPLVNIPELRFNTTYSVYVRPIIPGRRTVFGQECQFTMKKLNFSIEVSSSSVQMTPIQGIIKVVDTSNNLFTQINTKVTLIASGNATGGGVINILNGIGTFKINDQLAEIIHLSLEDTFETGIYIDATSDVEFTAIPPKFIIRDPQDSIQGTPVEVTIQAQNVDGTVNTEINLQVTLVASAPATVSNNGVVQIINGIGLLTVNCDSVAVIHLSLVDSDNTGLDVSSVQDVSFSIAPASKIVILPVNPSIQGTPVTVEIRVFNSFDLLISDWNIGVTLFASGNATGAGVVQISGGIGTIEINDLVKETITLTLQDTEGTGLDITSSQNIEFKALTGLIFEDLFTEDLDTTLANHTPDMGQLWEMVLQINSGLLQADETDNMLVAENSGQGKGVLYVANVANGYLNPDYQAETLVVNGGNNKQVSILALRVIDQDNMYAAKFNSSGYSIFKKVSGIWTQLAASGAGGNVTDGSIVKFLVKGNVLSLFENYNLLTTVTDSSITLPGKAGIGMGAVITSTDKIQNQQLDNFKVFANGDTLSFLDQFEGVSSQLENHTPDNGTGWTQIINVGTGGQQSQGIKVNNGIAEKTAALKQTGFGSFYLASMNPVLSSTDYETEMKIIKTGDAESTVILGIRVSSDGQNGYFMRISEIESKLYKRINGVWSQLGVTVNGVDNKIVRFRAKGNEIQFIVDENIIINTNDGDINLPGSAGFGFGAIIDPNDVEKNQNIDDFVIRIL